jgi:hypothetical protein
VSDAAPTLNYAAPDSKPDRIRLILRAFRSKNYRLFFAGQLVSMVGNFLTMVATAWLVYRSASWASRGRFRCSSSRRLAGYGWIGSTAASCS